MADVVTSDVGATFLLGVAPGRIATVESNALLALLVVSFGFKLKFEVGDFTDKELKSENSARCSKSLGSSTLTKMSWLVHKRSHTCLYTSSVVLLLVKLKY